MKTIKHYTVKIVTKTGMCEKEIKNDFDIVDVELLGENETRYVLNDEHFTVIKKGECPYSTCVDKQSIGSDVNNDFWGTRITYSLYTFKAKRSLTIKKEIADYIEHRYGGFANIDLDFIK